jgi:hypothetical protein
MGGRFRFWSVVELVGEAARRWGAGAASNRRVVRIG